MLDYLTSALVTLFVISDPIMMSGIFVGLTRDLSPEQRREVAFRGPVIAFGILFFAGLGGAQLLSMLGISLAAFRISGGLLLLSAAAEMVFDRSARRQEQDADTAITVDHVKNIAAFPLAIPLMAGPGAITAMILLAGKAHGDVRLLGGLYGVAALVLLSNYVCFRLAGPISASLGITGRVVVSRLLGIILAALAVQFIGDGVSQWLSH